jgi:hypothetical protein
MMSRARRALGWGGAFVFFVVTGPILFPILMAATSKGPAPGSPIVHFSAIVFGIILFFTPYVLWCLYFFIRSAQVSVGITEHLLIVSFFTPMVWFFASAIAYSMAGISDEPFWVLAMPFIYAWQVAQYVVVQLFSKRLRNRTASA